MIKTSTIVASGLLLAGCQSQLLHYKVLDKAPEFRPPTINAFAITPQADDAPAFVKGLSDRGQAALIQALAASAKDAKPDGLLALVAKDYEPASPDCSAPHTLTLKKRIVFTLNGQQARQADRIDRVDLQLRIPNPQAPVGASQPRATIVSWDRFDTKYDSYNLGSATYSQTGKFSLGKASSASITAGAEYDNGLTETVAYSMRRITLGGTLTQGGDADLLLEGGPLIGLFGSFSAVVSLQVPTNVVMPTYVYRLSLTKDGADLAAANASVERCLDIFAERADRIDATIEGIALDRVVVEGFETVTESDDRVVFLPYRLQKMTFPLVKEDELATVRYGLVGQCGKKQECAIHIEDDVDSDVYERLSLRTPQEARALRAWLAGSPTMTIGKRRLVLQRRDDKGVVMQFPVKRGDVTELQIRVVNSNTGIATNF